MAATYLRYGEPVASGNTLPASAGTGALFYLTVGAIGLYLYRDDQAWHLFDNVSWSGGEVLPIYALADFPDPVAGVIPLADNTTYRISGTVDISPNRLACGIRNTIVGTDRLNDILKSDTTGALLTVGSGDLVLVCNTITLQAANGSVFDVNAAGLSVAECSPKGASLGTFTNALSVTFRQSGMISAFTTGGATFTGTCAALRVFDNVVSGNAGTLFALGTCVFQNVYIDRNAIVQGAGTTFLSGTIGGANVALSGVLMGNTFSGAGTFISTLTNADAGWAWVANVGVTNTPLSVAWGAVTGTLSAQTDVQAALDAKQALSAKGAANGYAGLDASSLVPVANLPPPVAPPWGVITGTLSNQTDLQNALNAKLATTGNGSGLTGLVKAQVSLGLADNTSDANKPVSTATQTALDAKQATLVSGTTIKTINGSSVLGSGDLAVSAADPSYTPGSFTVATGTGRLLIKRLHLTTTQRVTLAGTARLKVA